MMPGTMSVFAEAYRRQQGADWDSKTALQELYGTLKPGKNLNTAELSPFLVEVLRERAAPKLDIAMQTSQAWQGRFQNARSDWTRTFSESGGEAGYRNVFRGFTGFMESFPEIPESSARTFESITRFMSKMITFPGDFKAMISGEDSLLAEWLGADVVDGVRKNLESVTGFVGKIQAMLPDRSEGGVDDPSVPYAGGLDIFGRVGKSWTNTIALGGAFADFQTISDAPAFGRALVEATAGTAYTALTGRHSLTGDLGNNVKYGADILGDIGTSILSTPYLSREAAWNQMQYESPTRQSPSISVNQLTIEVEAREAENPKDLADRIYDNFRSTILNFGDN